MKSENFPLRLDTEIKDKILSEAKRTGRTGAGFIKYCVQLYFDSMKQLSTDGWKCDSGEVTSVIQTVDSKYHIEVACDHVYKHYSNGTYSPCLRCGASR